MRLLRWLRDRGERAAQAERWRLLAAECDRQAEATHRAAQAQPEGSALRLRLALCCVALQQRAGAYRARAEGHDRAAAELDASADRWAGEALRIPAPDRADAVA